MSTCGRHLIVVTLAALTLSGCIKGKSPAEAFAKAQRRNLTPAEKTALAKVLPQTLKDPRSAQFKWMPVILITGSVLCAARGGPNRRN
jgi:PBP1b-binding outer membrane lipoprotein LpoB